MGNESTSSLERAERVDHQLVRGIGIPALTANIVSSTIGAGIFVIPATVAKGLGSAAPLAFVCCAIAMVLFVTCFAIAGSRVSLTGGLYAYVEVAFGRYVGFLAGMLYFLTALGAVAGVVNVLANSVALVVPFLGGPVMRIIVMFAVYGSLVLINIRGVRQGAGAVTVITVAKLLPLLLFICVGIFFIHTPNLAWSGWPSSKSLGDAVILLIFAFVGIEVALIPSGEVKNPARTVPRSAYLALVITTIIYLMIQLVAQGTLGPDLANHPDAPLAESAATIPWQPRPDDSSGRSEHLRIWICDERHPEFAANDFCFRPRRRVAAIFRACAPALSVTRCRDYYVRCARVCAVNQRHIRATGGPFECRGSVDVSALLRCLLGFGATGCALGW